MFFKKGFATQWLCIDALIFCKIDKFSLAIFV